jgi:hypothetical protein
VAAAGALTGLIGFAAIGASARPDTGPMDEVREATADLHTIDAAAAAGYAQFLGCIDEPGQGAMGIHFVKVKLVGDGEIELRRPEALMFGIRPNGQPQLLGVEYIVPKALWDSNHPDPPSLFHHEFHVVPAPNRFGLDAFYALHAWTELANPAGDHNDWNPRVLCPAAPDRAPGT